LGHSILVLLGRPWRLLLLLPLLLPQPPLLAHLPATAAAAVAMLLLHSRLLPLLHAWPTPTTNAKHFVSEHNLMLLLLLVLQLGQGCRV
jgi:hypothetical protein